MSPKAYYGGSVSNRTLRIGFVLLKSIFVFFFVTIKCPTIRHQYINSITKCDLIKNKNGRKENVVKFVNSNSS